MINKTIENAAESHTRRTGHRNIVRGMNFVECQECSKHAHLNSTGKKLIVHDSSHKNVEHIEPEEF